MTLTGGRSSLRTGLITVGWLTAIVLVAGCSSVFEGEPGTAGGNGGASGVPYEHESGAQDVLVSVDVAGGLVPLEHSLRNTAEFLLLGDATVIVAGVTTEIFPGPAISPLQSGTVSEQQIQELFAAAEEAGLLAGEIEYGDPGVTDMPATQLSITVDGQTFSQSAYALGFDDSTSLGLSAAEVAARTALQGFLDTARGTVGAEGERFVPAEVLAYRFSAQAAPPVEEPELIQEPMPWPIATLPPPVAETYPSSCVEIAGPEAVELLAALEGANELTPWLIGTEAPSRLAFRPLLPGDAGCER